MGEQAQETIVFFNKFTLITLMDAGMNLVESTLLNIVFLIMPAITVI